MAKFNKSKDVVVETTNKQGGYAIERKPKDELVMMTVCNLIGEPNYYDSGASSLKEYEHAIDNVLSFDPEFVLKLAVYARTELHLRSAPMFIINRYTMQTNRIVGASKYIDKAIQRVDDMTELVAMQLAYCGCVTNPVKRGVAKAFLKFDEYQYAKYKAAKHDVSLRDVMFIVHPKPDSGERELIFNKIANNTLAPPDTWEVAISTGGNTKENWINIIPKMGIMAIVRNLRNFEQAGVPVEVYKDKFNEYTIKRSRMFPYRFYNAYRNVNSRDNEELLLDAMEHSIKNIPDYNGKTAVLVDVSGSMGATVSANSSIRLYEIGAFMGSCLASKQRDVQVIAFGTSAKEIPIKAHDNLMSITDKLTNVQGTIGYGTNLAVGMNLVDDDVERIIIMSDMQFGNFTLDVRDYKGGKPIYAFNLESYPHCSFNKQQKCIEIGGFSDKVFDLIELLESGKLSQIVDTYHL